MHPIFCDHPTPSHSGGSCWSSPRRDPRSLKFRQFSLRSFGFSSPVLSSLLHDHSTYGQENKIEHKELRSLTVGSTHVALHERISQRQHGCKNHNGGDLA